MSSTRLFAVGLAILAAVAMVSLSARAQGMMGPGGWGHTQTPLTGPVTIDQAVDLVRQFVVRLGNLGLAPVEIMEFTDGFYVIVAEESTQIGAFELLVNRKGFIRQEPGPNTTWNTKYGRVSGGGYNNTGGHGMGGGMMGGGGNPGYGPVAPVPIGPQLSRPQAHQAIQVWLNQAFPGARATKGTAFYGYVTFDFDRNGKTLGIASVHAYTGRVWYHNWHGTFVRKQRLP